MCVSKVKGYERYEIFKYMCNVYVTASIIIVICVSKVKSEIYLYCIVGYLLVIIQMSIYQVVKLFNKKRYLSNVYNILYMLYVIKYN